MKTSIAFLLLIFTLAACAPASATALVPPTATLTVELTAEATESSPTAEFYPATEAIPSPTLTPIPYYGYLEFPFRNADAGNFQLQTGAVITFTWIDPPLGAEYYEFVLHPFDGSPAIVLGRDTDPSDGVSLEWVVPPGLSAELRAHAYYADGTPARGTFAPAIYSPSGS